MRAHAAAAAELLIGTGVTEGRELVAALISGAQPASVSPQDQALYSAIEVLVARRNEIDEQLYADLRAVGWSEGQLLETITVCALFCFYNAWVDSSGADELEESDYRASGRRLAQFGYLHS